MAFFYVKGGGAATGDGGRAASKRTGVWNASTGTYYDTVDDALSATTAPTAGDIICWSDASVDELPASTSFEIPDGVHLIVVDDTNQDQYKRATASQITQTGGNRLSITMGDDAPVPGLHMGSYTVTNNQHTAAQSPVGQESLAFIHDVTVQTDRSTGLTFFVGPAYGGVMHFHNYDFTATSNPNQMLVGSNGGVVLYIGGSFTNTTNLLQLGDRGSNIKFMGVDLSGMGASPVLVDMKTGGGSGAAYFYRCDLPLNWTITNLSDGAQFAVIVESCDSEYQYELHTYQGEVNFVTSRYHDDDPMLSDNNSKGSYGFLPNTNVSATNPLLMAHTIMPRWLMAENANAVTNNKVRLKFASDGALDTASLWAYVCYPTNADNVVWTSVRHQISPLESGSALSTQPGKWIGAGTTNQYILDIPMTSPGNGLVAVMVGVTVDEDVYLSPVIEFVP